jgi:hypothetical protein
VTPSTQWSAGGAFAFSELSISIITLAETSGTPGSQNEGHPAWRTHGAPSKDQGNY